MTSVSDSTSALLLPTEPRRASLRLWVIGFTAFCVVRLAIAGVQPIVADEAVYWSWSRHPAWCYLDHPPMVAFLIRIGCAIFGDSPLGVRFFAATLTVGAVAVTTLIAGQLLNLYSRQLVWIAALLLMSPLVVVLATIMTPDTPAIFFSLCVLASVIGAIESERWSAALWIAAGVLQGLSMVAKYTTVLTPASIFLALLCTPAGRRHLLQPWPYVSAMLAALVFLPVVGWNASHDWVSFRFQLNHGLAAGGESIEPSTSSGGMVTALENLADYVGGQAMVWNPVLFILGALALTWNVRRYREIGLPRQVLIWATVLPLAFFAIASVRAKGQPNWPALAYFPLAILTIEYVLSFTSDQATVPQKAKWLKIGMAVGLIGAGGLSFPAIAIGLGIRPTKFDELSGWDRFAADLDAHREGMPVVCDNARDGGQIAFNLPGKPEVWVYAGGTKPTSFAYMDDRPDPWKFAELAYVGEHAQKFCTEYGFSQVSRKTIRAPLATGRTRFRNLAILVRNPCP